MKEYSYDKLLNIHTNEKGTPNQLGHYYPYEPTPYEALEALFEQYELESSDHVVDFGCGLGRLNFFIHYFYQASVVGVEMNEISYRKALQNQKQYAKKIKKPIQRVEFKCCRAEDYGITEKDNRFYFFNPFSIHIFQRIINRILRSVEESPREVDIILYYPSEDYIYYMDNQSVFRLDKEIVVPGYFEKNPNERFLIYRLNI
ncbi:cyclopropane-fatty-acyl-phospholipid synthase family protein [Paucisalibacillus sp. EB02]|uniref:SAM-dependent methyltransferase n=1 Tax=Paucisalibacillus sp. EB02 TaxID=1347087 RepID=UPI0004B99433|nr:methyltransferase [Paucisalibacillus sp. EB02]